MLPCPGSNLMDDDVDISSDHQVLFGDTDCFLEMPQTQMLHIRLFENHWQQVTRIDFGWHSGDVFVLHMQFLFSLDFYPCRFYHFCSFYFYLVFDLEILIDGVCSSSLMCLFSYLNCKQKEVHKLMTIFNTKTVISLAYIMFSYW